MIVGVFHMAAANTHTGHHARAKSAGASSGAHLAVPWRTWHTGEAIVCYTDHPLWTKRECLLSVVVRTSEMNALVPNQSALSTTQVLSALSELGAMPWSGSLSMLALMSKTVSLLSEYQASSSPEMHPAPTPFPNLLLGTSWSGVRLTANDQQGAGVLWATSTSIQGVALNCITSWLRQRASLLSWWLEP